MQEDLVGYLLDALESDERARVEHALERDAELRRRLERLRRAMKPLAMDADPIEPPPGLRVRAVARMAEVRCRTLPRAPAPVANRGGAGPWTRWRRPDALVAAAILLCLSLLIPPAINRARYSYEVAACKNNLRTFYVALKDFSERHGGNFPNVAAAPEPKNVAGIFIPILNEEKLLPATVTVSCPPEARQPVSRLSLRDVERMDQDEFNRCVANLAGDYAYTLGYDDGTGLRGLRFDPEQPNSISPILADRPPAAVGAGDPGNSPNHNGYGQNVLYIDGHCAFATRRTAGVNGDDIYLNHDNKVGAGKGIWDSVLAGSAAHP